MTEDVRQERRLLDRRQRVFRHIARRIMAATEQAKLPHNAELVAKADGLASGNSCAPYFIIASIERSPPNDAAAQIAPRRTR
jgi:hypothetical protein